MNGKRQALGLALDQDDGQRKEHLAALVVELGGQPHALRVAQRLGARAMHRAPTAAQIEADDLIVVRGIDESRRPRRIDDLVAALGKASEQPVQVALRLRRQEQLRLLDQEDLADHGRLAAILHDGEEPLCGHGVARRGPCDGGETVAHGPGG